MRIYRSTLFGEKKTTPKRKITEEQIKKENKIRIKTVQTKLDLSVKDDINYFYHQTDDEGNRAIGVSS
jgi:hypothetical protein